jgi:formate/nitrite transporter FocA (FNT family)
VPVTIGNIIGGSLMVGAIYWFVYLRSTRASEPSPAGSSATNPAA